LTAADAARAPAETPSHWLDSQGVGIALRLTLLDLLLAPIGAWNVRAAVLLLAGAGLLHAGILRAPVTWLALALLTAWRVYADWPMSDNHAYLLSYWCFAVFLALSGREARSDLVRSARLLIGLAFAFAVLWKGVLAADYTDDRFFRQLLLTDQRFEDLTTTLGGMTPDILEDTRDLIEKNRHVEERDPPAGLETAALRKLATVATWSTLTIETLVALLFLLPVRVPTGRLRDFALMAFCATTYAVAPVPGFGWVLLAMGVAQCPESARATRWLYLACFALVLLHDFVPWFEVLPQAS
jgi:hypothetical protein